MGNQFSNKFNIDTEDDLVIDLKEDTKVKTSITLPATTFEASKKIAESKKISFSEVVRRALKVTNFLYAVLSNGGSILVQPEKDEPYRRLKLDED